MYLIRDTKIMNTIVVDEQTNTVWDGTNCAVCYGEGTILLTSDFRESYPHLCRGTAETVICPNCRCLHGPGNSYRYTTFGAYLTFTTFTRPGCEGVFYYPVIDDAVSSDEDQDTDDDYYSDSGDEYPDSIS